MSTKICIDCVMEKINADFPYVNKNADIRNMICRNCIKIKKMKRLNELPDEIDCKECLMSISKNRFPLGSKICVKCTNIRSMIRRSQKKYNLDITNQICKICKIDKDVNHFALSLESKHCVRRVCKSCARLSSGGIKIMNHLTEPILSV
jgi:hypothetical protein